MPQTKQTTTDKSRQRTLPENIENFENLSAIEMHGEGGMSSFERVSGKGRKRKRHSAFNAGADSGVFEKEEDVEMETNEKKDGEGEKEEDGEMEEDEKKEGEGEKEEDEKKKGEGEKEDDENKKKEGEGENEEDEDKRRERRRKTKRKRRD